MNEKLLSEAFGTITAIEETLAVLEGDLGPCLRPTANDCTSERAEIAERAPQSEIKDIAEKLQTALVALHSKVAAIRDRVQWP